MTTAPESSRPARSVLVWLGAVYVMIFAMVLIGGITRLTGSGLSMVEWRPLIGAVPPLDDASWQTVFSKYQQSPQYHEVNDWMTLADFKRIFLWEYVHRLFGRLIGLVFVVPWLVLIARRRLDRRLAMRSVVAFILGGLQGLLGWYMVKSGLVDVPAVSHYRLAAHFGLALAVACYVLWLLLDLLPCSQRPTPKATARLTWALFGVVSLQVVYGAFIAGTRAGYIYPTFPDINGKWLEPQAIAYEPLWRNFAESPYGIHYFHRMFGFLVAIAVLAYCASVWRSATSWQSRLATRALPILVVLQIALGGITVMLRVPTWSAAAHQAGGFLMLSLTLIAAHTFQRATTADDRASAPQERAPSAL